MIFSFPILFEIYNHIRVAHSTHKQKNLMPSFYSLTSRSMLSLKDMIYS